MAKALQRFGSPMLTALGLWASACAHPPGRPAASSPGAAEQASPDAELLREVVARAPVRYVSALAYRHYVEALLARSRDALPLAASELREALLFDPESAHLHTLLAETQLRLGRVTDAEDELKIALALDPGHGPARLLAAQIASAAHSDDLARTHLAAALQADPDDADAWRELVRLEVARSRLMEAHAAAESLAAAARRALEVAASSRRNEEAGVLSRDLRGADWQAHRTRLLAAESFVEVARARAAQRDDVLATEEFARAGALAPSEESVLAAQGAFLESRRQIAEARALQLRILARRPDAPEALAALGRLALHAGDPDGAQAYAAKLRQLAAELAQDDHGRDDDRHELAQAMFRLGLPLLGSNHGKDSLQLFDSALRLVPGNTALTFYRAVALARVGRAQEAAQVFEQLAGEPARAPGFLDVDRGALLLDAQVQGALARARAGQLDEACVRLRQLVATHPTEEAVGIALLEAYERAGRQGEAVQILARAAEEHPRTEALLYALASAQDRSGDRAAAFGTMRRLLALDPQHAGALNYVGYSLAQRGGPPELQEAEQLLRRATALRPDDGGIADSLGYTLLRLGHKADALSELERADHLSPDDPVILSHLGDAYLAAGRKDDAATAFRRALRDLGPRALNAQAEASRDTRVEPVHAEIPRFEPPDRAAPDPRPDAPDRLPDPTDARVRDELEQKLRSLTAR